MCRDWRLAGGEETVRTGETGQLEETVRDYRDTGSYRGGGYEPHP